MSTMQRNIEVRAVETAVRERNPNELKFGIGTTPPIGQKSGELADLAPDQPLTEAIAAVCQTWGFTDPSIFALRFNEPPHHYVTESSRKKINGKIVQMYYSPEYVSKELIKKLKSSTALDIGQGLKELAEKTSDPTLDDVFVSLDGLNSLIELIEKETRLTDQEIQYALQALLDLMLLSNKTSWDSSVRPSLISK